MNEHQTNGNGSYANGHSNGYEKPFVLARPETPEEQRRKELLKLVPKFRRATSSLKMLAQAKWLYNQLTDDSFLTDFGGDSFGTIYTSIKDIAGRYRHDRDSISKWLALLERKEVVWLEWAHPFCLIHITAIVPRPQERATMLQRMRARAGSARFSRAEGVGTPFFKPSSGEPALNAEENRTISGNVPARRAEGIGTTCGHLPHGVRKVSVENDRQLPQTPPVTPADRAGTSPHTSRVSSADGADSVRISHRQSSTGTASNDASKESPKKESQERVKGEPTPRNEVEEAAIKDGDTGFGDWCDSWKLRTEANPNGEYRGKLVKELSRCKVKLQIAPAPFWQRRAEFLQTQLDGGKPPVRQVTVRPIKTTTGTTSKIPDEKFDKLAKETLAQMRKAVAA